MTRWLMVALALGAGCGKKNVPSAPLEGWHQEEEWAGACFYPKNFDSLGVGDRRMERQKTLEAMMSQWQGGRGDGVSFGEDAVTSLETVLLGKPELVETVAVQNLQWCQKSMAGEGPSGWGRWLAGLPAKLTEGDCRYAPLDYTLFDYLDIGRGWQIPVQVCEGNAVRVRASTNDKYRIVEKGAWIDAAGDPEKRATAIELPCNYEGCFEGQLILRFTGDSGRVDVVPVGAERAFTAPEHGRLEVQINDTTWFDNTYRTQGGITDHTSIEYSPAN